MLYLSLCYAHWRSFGFQQSHTKRIRRVARDRTKGQRKRRAGGDSSSASDTEDSSSGGASESSTPSRHGSALSRGSSNEVDSDTESEPDPTNASGLQRLFSLVRFWAPLSTLLCTFAWAAGFIKL